MIKEKPDHQAQLAQQVFKIKKYLEINHFLIFNYLILGDTGPTGPTGDKGILMIRFIR